VSKSHGEHSGYPGALVDPDGEIYFRREGTAPDEASDGKDATQPAAPIASTTQLSDRKDAQQ
jgi:hypothetical protein